MNNEFDQYVHDEQGPADWRIPLIWSAFLALGFIVLEITARPQWGLAFVCLKFGWSYFRSAFWLLRTDPNRQRGWACFWLYLGAGLFEASIVASLITFALPFIQIIWFQLNPAWQQAPLNPLFEIFQVLLITIVGFGLASISTLFAVWLGWRHGFRFWVDSKIGQARQKKAWPPSDTCVGGRNWAHSLIVTSLMVLVYLFILAGVTVIISAASKRLPDAEDIICIFFGCLALFIPFGAVFMYLLGIPELSYAMLVAKTPWECWRGDQSVQGVVGLEDSAHPTGWS